MTITRKKLKNVKKYKKIKNTNNTNNTNANNTNKKYNTNKTKKGGADFFGGLIQVPKKKNYNVQIPGSRYAEILNPNLFMSVPQKNSKNISNSGDKLKIIFNYRMPNPKDISKLPNNTILFSNVVSKEPYLFINSMGKYLVVMYKEELNNQNLKIKLLYWLIGYINYTTKKIFSYIEPNVPTGSVADFTIKIYKIPDNYNIDFNLIKINIIVNHDNVYNKTKLNKAYDEFLNTYITPFKLVPTTIINFKVKGSEKQGIDLLTMLSKKFMKMENAKMAKMGKMVKG
jgi:hypothetical protein